MRIDGWLHADCAQQLQGVVLHHVTQGARGLVKRAPFFHAQFFSYRDLDVGDVFTPPEWLKQCVAKTQCKQVLYGGFAQIVVDTENLAFLENPAHGLVDVPIGGQVMSQRLFQHYPGVGRVQATGGELFAHSGEQRRGGGHIHHHRVGVAVT